jgi:hypothetical protein
MSPEDEAKLKALREAVQIGIADLEAGRYRTLTTDREIEDYVRSVMLSAGNRRKRRRRKR